MSLNLVFMGTPEFAVPSLTALIEAGHTISLVVTQPDKPVGRKKVLTAPPVKKLALEHGIEVYQPGRIKKNNEAYEKLKSVDADFFVVVAYGKILPKEILDLPRHACVNVHASLLPAYRGAAPIHWSIVKGESVTGVTTMLMDVGMDTGDMLLKAETPILESDTTPSLSEKLSHQGAALLLQTLEPLKAGEIQPQKQDESQATTIPLLKKTHGLIDWKASAREVFNLVRGLKPWPEAYTYFDGKALKIREAALATEQFEQGVPGQVLHLKGDKVWVQTGEGALVLKRVQLAGSKEMDAGSFARGKRVEPGTLFESQLMA